MSSNNNSLAVVEIEEDAQDYFEPQLKVLTNKRSEKQDPSSEIDPEPLVIRGSVTVSF